MPRAEHILWRPVWTIKEDNYLLNSVEKGSICQVDFVLSRCPVTPESHSPTRALDLGSTEIWQARLALVEQQQKATHTNSLVTVWARADVSRDWGHRSRWRQRHSLTSQVHWCLLPISASSWCCTPPGWRPPRDTSSQARFSITLQGRNKEGLTH